MDPAGAGHESLMAASPERSASPSPPAPAPLDFAAVYDENAAFVWRCLHLFGVSRESLDDAMQDVFLVVHRRLGEFEGRAAVRTWLYAIARRVAHNHRRGVQRRGQLEPISDELGDPAMRGPHDLVERAEAGRLLVELVARLDDDKREVFVLIEVEQLSAPEVSELLGVNLNTVYSRLRAARMAFERELAARRAREPEGTR
ncbi:MAG TPA: sigma-70 family RNA polymerase sigma factor [Kofleriaceae bacterium]|nr:sigma-70 family RNA polymerase sigma factor [Kofleriaceae bacterium]